MGAEEVVGGADDRYREKGIRFVLGTAEHEERVWQLIIQEFMPDEPVFR